MPCIRLSGLATGCLLFAGCFAKVPAALDSSPATSSSAIGGDQNAVECSPRPSTRDQHGPWRVVALDRNDGTVWDLTSKSPGDPAVVKQYFQYTTEPGQRTLPATWEFRSGELSVSMGGSDLLLGARLQGTFRDGDKLTLGLVEIRDQLLSEKDPATYRKPIVIAVDQSDSFWDVLQWMHKSRASFTKARGFGLSAAILPARQPGATRSAVVESCDQGASE